MKLTILGCGGSMGVPAIGGDWGACDPSNPKNYRTRSSIIVEKDSFRILVDTTPDLREQLLKVNIGTVDAVLYTHAHADHVNGIDDLRVICKNIGKPLDIYANKQTLSELQTSFSYAFKQPNGDTVYKPTLIPHEVNEPFKLGGINITPFDQDHGFSTTLGFRFNDTAYSTDVVNLDETALSILKGIKVWVVDCTQIEHHNTHAYLEKTINWIDIVKPERAILTHMNQSMDYAALKELLPSHVEPGYDGLILMH
jgi:phosphoribosyl 1,2-cyclic phosphate phosphodiesterase